jgi:hypothetical protein
LRTHVGLYEGVGELDLSNVFDAHGHTFAAKVISVGRDRFVTTAHGLTLMPTTTNPGALDRMMIAGPNAREEARALTSALPSTLAVAYIHADDPRFGLEPVLEDLARTTDVATATFALRRLEYRSKSIQLEGSRIPWGVFLTPFALAAASVAVTLRWRWAAGALRRGTSSARAPVALSAFARATRDR